MTDSNNDKRSKSPTLSAYHVKQITLEKKIWTRIGSAWQHGDGKGFSIQVDVVPLDGRITLRTPSEDQQ